MRKKSTVSLLTVLFVAVMAAMVFAGPWKGWRGSGGWGAGGAYQRMYNTATVETITGTVETVDRVTPLKGMNYGIHLLVKTEKGDVSVHLGPSWYIERLDTKITTGDAVEVKGSRVTFNGKPAIIAAEMKKGETVLKLRDDNGIPVWAGWRR